MYFSPAEDWQVPEIFRNEVTVHLLKAVFELGISVPIVEYLIPNAQGSIHRKDEYWAGALCNRVEFRIDIPLDQLRDVVRHECRHVWQFENGCAYADDSEDDAWRFARSSQFVYQEKF